ncbi:myosin heavy chain-like [Gossypium australe]|uniref:Myosin heavy chain-like n=1 Tax=Gossypium australe TaxID=47621 RepID=A0A5B6VXK5_9ROSI|nr:myosin heavy chain-like [Gossypium australe]
MRAGKGRFIGCAQMLLAWFHSHFWKVDKVSYRDFSENYSPLKEIVATSRRDDISEENWTVLLCNLQDEDIEWRAPWAGILIGSLYLEFGEPLDMHHYLSRQFIPTTHGLAQSEFSYKGESYKKRVKEISNAWNRTRRMKRMDVSPMMTLEYSGWLSRRVNDNLPMPSLEGARSIEEYLREVPLELKMIKQDFERRNSELRNRIEKLEQEKVYLRLDVDVQKSEVEKIRKEKWKIEEDRDSLKVEYKRIRLTMKNAGLGKTSEQWQREIREEKAKVNCWERKFQEMQARNKALEKNLAESQNEKKQFKS